MGILSVLVLIPFFTALVVIFTPKSKAPLYKWICALGTGFHLILTAVMTFQFWGFYSIDRLTASQSEHTKLYLIEKWDWIKPFNIEYFLGVDGLSVSMMILTSIIIFTGVIASWNVIERSKEFFTFLLVLVTGVFGVFVSFDLFLFFVFYEVAVLPMYLLIGVWGTGQKEYSAMKLTLMLMAGSALILAALLAIYHAGGSFNLIALGEKSFDFSLQYWAYPALFIGFGVLGALFPFHTWSPDGHAAAPTAVSMLHAGVLMKLGGYGILRVAMYLFPQGAIEWAMPFLILATFNVVYGAFGAIKQKDLKYFTAYSSVSHCGFILFGLATLNFIGIKGAMIQMFSHGIMTGLFFSLIGMVYGRTHTRIIPDMGGLFKVMPWLGVSFYIGGLASLGLPSLSGFIAESHIFVGGFMGSPHMPKLTLQLLTALVTMSIVVTAVYVLRGLAQVFQGEIKNKEFENLKDAKPTEKIVTAILIATLFFVGLFPSLIIHLIEGSIWPFMNRLN